MAVDESAVVEEVEVEVVMRIPIPGGVRFRVVLVVVLASMRGEVVAVRDGVRVERTRDRQ